MYDWVEFGNRLRITRMMRGFSQARLAGQIGISVAQLRAYEYGKHQMTVDMLAAIAQTLNASAEYLATGKMTGGCYPSIGRLREGAPRGWWARCRLTLTHPFGISRQRPVNWR